MGIFAGYSKYYDLLYQDKDYKKEAAYVDGIIKTYLHTPHTMLEFGCGTGRYSREFINLGYSVHGVDFSRDMLEEASRFCFKGLRFSYGDMRFARFEERYDVIVSLFHVLSYQTREQDVSDALQTILEHLSPEGIAIFDFWYGPAVLTQRPEVRVKEVEDDEVKITRIARPVLLSNENIVNVNYDTFIELKKNMHLSKLKECHSMRYFFDTEICRVCKGAGFNVLKICGWMSLESPSIDSWAAVVVLQRQ